MLIGKLIHPQLLSALAAAGHGSQILVADALYPHSSGTSGRAERVHLNLTAGLIAAPDVLKVLSETIYIEAATYMRTAEGTASEPVLDYQTILANHRHGGGKAIAWTGIDRHDFYRAARSDDVTLLIATGDIRPYANLLLTIGVP